MMKNILKGLYLVLIIFAGVIYFNAAKAGRATSLYIKEAIPSIASGDINTYVDKTMITLSNDRFINRPIYEYEAISESLNFNFDIYHFEKKTKDEVKSGLQFILHDFTNDNFMHLLHSKSEYENNKGLVRVILTVTTDLSNVAPTLSFSLFEQISKVEKYETNGSAADNTLFIVNEEGIEEFYFLDSNGGKNSFNEIRSFKFSLYDGTNPDESKREILLGRLEGETPSKFFVKEELEVDGNLFSGNIINSKPSDYVSLGEYYANNTNITVVDPKALSNYNGDIFRTVILFTILMAVVTFFLYFFNPIMEKIKKNRLLKKEQKENII